jgi:flagellar basal-body rod protein FlgG
MLEGLYAAAAGMSAQQQQMDAIGNDLANASTTGYKSERVGFRDLLYSQVEEAGTATTSGDGAAAQMIGRDQVQGAVEETGNPLDLAVQGEGYFQVKRADGSTGLTRDGALSIDSTGELTTADGSRLEPPVKLPRGATASEISIASDGTVLAGGHPAGKIALVSVPAPDKLLADGTGQFSVTKASGAASPAHDCTLRQGALEGSNVNVAQEMTTMMTTQRSYQMASSAIQTQDQMMSIANQLRS